MEGRREGLDPLGSLKSPSRASPPGDPVRGRDPGSSGVASSGPSIRGATRPAGPPAGLGAWGRQAASGGGKGRGEGAARRAAFPPTPRLWELLGAFSVQKKK